jgi:hypothetical protein
MRAKKRPLVKAKPKAKLRSITLRCGDGHWEMLQDIQHDLGKKMGKQQSGNSTLLVMIEAEYTRRFGKQRGADAR